MYRKIIKDLIKWKNSSDRKPLILDGARQVGKTHLIEKIFGKEYYGNVLRVNMQNPPSELSALFEGEINPERIVRALSVMYNTKITPGETLIFFDEVQDIPRALTSLKYFYEDAPDYHIIAAGSLLGVFLKKPSDGRPAPFPVGKVDTLRLEPMDFEEYLYACSEHRYVDALMEAPDEIAFDGRLKDLLREYLVIGGMPEAVKAWLVAHDITKVNKIQHSILQDYRRDFKKYTDPTTAIRITEIFDSLPAQFAKQNSDKFVYGVVREGARGREYNMAIEWLRNSGTIRYVPRVSCGNLLPLKAYVEHDAFKLYFLDIGLFRQLADIPPNAIFRDEEIFSKYNGLLAEQYILQQLSTKRLYYWGIPSQAEVDFVFQHDTSIIPIEAKSGIHLESASLSNYRRRYAPSLALRFSLRPLKYDDGILNIPLYKAFLVDRLLQKYTKGALSVSQ